MAQIYLIWSKGSIVPVAGGPQHGPSPNTETESMSKRTVLVVDLQNDYLPTGKFPLVGIEAAIDNAARVIADARAKGRSEEHTSELQSLMRISYAVFCLKKTNTHDSNQKHRD